jgi:outer membrane protein OmpA-like peptidoglycan-associated protein
VEEEDTEFFILVLGVLAAIILVVTWWFSAGGTTPSVWTTTSSSESADHGDDGQAGDEGHDDDGDGQALDDSLDDDESAGATNEESAGDTDKTATDSDTSATRGPLPSSVFDAIAANDDLRVVRDLLRDSNLDQVLASGGPYTVFAPSNDAISQAAGSDATVSVLENDSEAVMSYHIVPGKYTLDELTDIARGSRSTALTTVQGESISLTLESGSLLINSSAAVSPDSIDTNNGVVHTLDNLLMPPIAALNTLVGLEPILFATGSADIDLESFVTLDGFIEVLGSSNGNVTIEGHTDSSGDPILNQYLSQSRARSVLNYLVGNGVDESRLDAQGMGPGQPVGDNDTEEGRALNRRIEFAVG